MHNTKITDNKDLINTQKNENSDKKPDEKSGIFVQAVIKIFDPETKETFVEKRA